MTLARVVQRRRLRYTILVALATFALPARGYAQPGAHLDRVEAALASGRLTEARQTLAAWQREVAPRAAAGEQARGLLLQARLAADFESARDAYLGVVLAHPSSPAAAEALLRLGQGLVAAGEHARAAAYLERLIVDYPNAPERDDATRWLERARRTPPRGAGEHARVQEEPGEQRFAIQAGAFHERAGAERTAAELRDAGFDARIVAIEGSALFRVRIGRFESARAATPLAGRLTALGHSAIIVDDAHRERP